MKVHSRLQKNMMNKGDDLQRFIKIEDKFLKLDIFRCEYIHLKYM